MEALGAMENRLRAYDASIKAKDEQYSRRNSVRIHHPGWIENNEENCMSLICNYDKDHHITLTPNDSW